MIGSREFSGAGTRRRRTLARALRGPAAWLLLGVAALVALPEQGHAQTPPDLTLGTSVVNYSYSEEDTGAFFRIAIKGPAGATAPVDLRVRYALFDITTQSALNQDERSDYELPVGYDVAAGGTATILAGETHVDVPVKFVNDTLAEHTERFFIQLCDAAAEGYTGATSGNALCQDPAAQNRNSVESSRVACDAAVPGRPCLSLNPAGAQMTILDTDTTTLAWLVPPEGYFQLYENAGPLILTTRAAPDLIGYGLSVVFLVRDDVGTPGTDYERFTETIPIDAYQRDTFTEIRIFDDDLPERYREPTILSYPTLPHDPIGAPLMGAESFWLDWERNGVDEDVRMPTDGIPVVILDDDPAFFVAGDAVSLAGSGTQTKQVPVSLAYAVPQAVSVAYELPDCAGTPTGTVTIPANATAATFPVAFHGTGAGAAKSFRVTLSSPSKGKIFDRSAPADSDLFDTRLQGVNVNLTKIATVAAAGLIAGIGGALYAHLNTYVEPKIFNVMLGVHGLPTPDRRARHRIRPVAGRRARHRRSGVHPRVLRLPHDRVRRAGGGAADRPPAGIARRGGRLPHPPAVPEARCWRLTG